MTDTTQPLPATPVIRMVSTEVTRPGDARPVYLVHAAGDVPELFVPKCAATCWCKR